MAELLVAIGTRHSLMDVYMWYYQAKRLVYKRDHPVGSEECQAAAKLRKQELGHYGHKAAELAGWYK